MSEIVVKDDSHPEKEYIKASYFNWSSTWISMNGQHRGSAYRLTFLNVCIAPKLGFHVSIDWFFSFSAFWVSISISITFSGCESSVSLIFIFGLWAFSIRFLIPNIEISMSTLNIFWWISLKSSLILLRAGSSKFFSFLVF